MGEMIYDSVLLLQVLWFNEKQGFCWKMCQEVESFSAVKGWI